MQTIAVAAIVNIIGGRWRGGVDYTDEEIAQLLGEQCGDKPEIIALARAELLKAPVLGRSGDHSDAVAIFLTRASLLLQNVRTQLQQNAPNGWLTEDQLRMIFMSTCGLASPDLHSSTLDYELTKGTKLAVSSAWLECRDDEAWHPGMRSGSGWFKKYCVTPLGKRQVLKKDLAHSPTAIEPVKPKPLATEVVPPWRRNTPPPPPPPMSTSAPTAPSASAQVAAAATVNNQNTVHVAPQFAIHVHVQPAAPAPIVTPPPASAPSGENERTPDDDSEGDQQGEPGTVSKRAQRAGQQYEYAMRHHFTHLKSPPSDLKVWSWVKENLPSADREKLPGFHTWSRYLREWRAYVALPKESRSEHQDALDHSNPFIHS